MNIEEVELSESFTHLRLTGVLDALGVGAIEKRFMGLTAGRKQNAVVELSGVRFCSSLGIRMLLSAGKALTREGKRLVLLSPSPEVAGILRLALLDAIMPVAMSLKEAKELFEAR
jgi:anti-anti-sigma factor